MARYALVIGVSENYSESLVSITQAQVDAEAMAALLKEHGNFRVTKLIGQVSRDEIAQAFKSFWQQAANSEALVFYSGHGLQVVDEDEFDPPEVVLAPSNCEVKLDKKNRVIWTGNELKLNSLNKQLARAEFSNLVMLLDCCHSGFLLEEESLRQTFQGLGGRDYVLLTACRGQETAWANGDSPYSVFTQVVLEGLSEAQADEQGIVTADTLIAYVKKQLRAADQEPVSLGAPREIELVRYHQQCVPKPTESEECPYQGLEAFTDETAKYFFGREAETTELLRRLEQCNFVPVIGPSGMGKSSVVRAGLVPRWQQQGGEVVMMKPDEAPFLMLKQALKNHWKDSISLGEQRRLCGLLNAKEQGLVALAEALPGENRLLLVVDQFEELFTLCRAEVCKRFIEQLVAVGQNDDSRLAIVMTMRSEFVTNWLLTAEIPELINQQKLEIRPLLTQGLINAICEPARIQKCQIGEGLLELILADVDSEPNSLPLLEFCLTELWKERDIKKSLLTAAVYRETGSLKGALNQRADAVFHSMTEKEKSVAQKVFLQLVSIRRDEADTRKRRTKEELLGLESDPAQRKRVKEVIDYLVEKRLLVTDSNEEQPTVDLAHEALMHGWERFVLWRRDDRDIRILLGRLEEAYRHWKEKGKRNNYLLLGGFLEEVKNQWGELKNIASEGVIVFGESSFSFSEMAAIHENILQTFMSVENAPLQEIMQTIVEKLLTCFRVDRSLIYRLENWTKVCLIANAAGSAWPFPLEKESQTIWGLNSLQNWTEDFYYLVADAGQSELTAAEQRQLKLLKIQSQLVVPIFLEDKLWGLLALQQCTKPRYWHNSDVKLLQIVVRQITVALLNDRLRREVSLPTADSKVGHLTVKQDSSRFLRSVPAAEPHGFFEQQLAVLKAISEQSEQNRVTADPQEQINALIRLNEMLQQAMADRTAQLEHALAYEAALKRVTDRVRDSLDEHQVVEAAVQELAVVLNANGCNAALYDLSEGTSTVAYEYASVSPAYQGRVAKMTNAPAIYQQLLEGQYFQFCSLSPHPKRGRVSMLACPIVDDQGIMGDLWLLNHKDYTFDDLEIRLVQQVANQCAIALRQSRLYQAAKSAANWMESHRVAQELQELRDKGA